SSDRPVVDDSFDVALLVRFTDVAALHAYEADPRHVKEVKEVLLPLTKKIQVYDFTR
ncbi:MAG TPA: stress protein, partial [Verrucomicrobiales bacterium]|nr:stress protein [Verrucomicrobiales bacterium]